MAWIRGVSLVLLQLGLGFTVFAQDVDENARNIFEALSKTLNCGKFKTLIIEAGLQTRYFYASNIQLTVFAPNDTAFMQLTKDRYDRIFNMSPAEKQDYVKSYTANNLIETQAIGENLVVRGLGPNSNKLFFHKQLPIYNNNAGRTKYYMNGAQIIQADVRAGNGIIQVIDRVLDPPIAKVAYGYIRKPDNLQPNIQMLFFSKFLDYISPDYYQKSILPMQYADGRITIFIPTDEAIRQIPQRYLDDLRSKPAELARVVQQHMIPEKAVYTSFVYHNHGYQTAEERSRVIFKKNIREQVYVSSGGVTALVVHGNMTVTNGVVHMIDNVLGLVYLTAWEQIAQGKDTGEFESLTNHGRKDLQDFLVRPNGVTVFVPTNEAFAKLRNLPGVDIINDQGLINMVFELHLLEAGTVFTLTSVNGPYVARQTPRSQYRGWRIKVYSEGNDTWAEGGYVKTRVIRPDVGVTNGYVHLVDGIFGIPSRDVPGIIFCEDWLIKTSYIMRSVGLNDYLSDVRIQHKLPECSSNDPRRNINYEQNSRTNTIASDNSVSQSNGLLRGGCGESGQLCDFTVFVPNGTTTDYFQQTEAGQKLFEDKNRLRYVLRRMIVRNRKIYIDQLSPGQRYFISETGDEIRLNVISDRSTVLEKRNYSVKVRFDVIFYQVAFILHGERAVAETVECPPLVIGSILLSGPSCSLGYFPFQPVVHNWFNKGCDQEVIYRNVRARILHSDLGATNGVIHIVDSFLFLPEDLTRNVFSTAAVTSPAVCFVLAVSLCFHNVMKYV